MEKFKSNTKDEGVVCMYKLTEHKGTTVSVYGIVGV